MTRRWSGWMATSPVKRWPSTWTGQIRSAPPEEQDAEPADRVAVDGPDLLAIGVGRQIGAEQADQPEDDEDPAVAPILAHARAEAAAGEEPDAGHDQDSKRKDGAGGMGEEGDEPAPAEDGEREIGEGRCQGGACELGRDRHDRLVEELFLPGHVCRRIAADKAGQAVPRQ